MTKNNEIHEYFKCLIANWNHAKLIQLTINDRKVQNDRNLYVDMPQAKRPGWQRTTSTFARWPEVRNNPELSIPKLVADCLRWRLSILLRTRAPLFAMTVKYKHTGLAKQWWQRFKPIKYWRLWQNVSDDVELLNRERMRNRPHWHKTTQLRTHARLPVITQHDSAARISAIIRNDDRLQTLRPVGHGMQRPKTIN